jgi:hypothetical protein
MNEPTNEWRCEWCGVRLVPEWGTWVGDHGSGDYCPEGLAVGEDGTSPHLPVRTAALAEREALDVERLAEAMVDEWPHWTVWEEGMPSVEFVAAVAERYAALAETPPTGSPLSSESPASLLP